MLQTITTDLPTTASAAPAQSDEQKIHGRFSGFATAWALSSIVTAGSFGFDRPAFLVLATALAVLIVPESVGLFLLLCASIALRIFLKLPEGPNHFILELLTALGFLIAGGVLFTQKKLTKAELIERAAPTARILMLIVYFFAVLDKLNYDYLSPHGCGWQLISPFFGGDNAAAHYPIVWRLGVYGSISTEALLMLGLATKRFRRQTLIAGACFHSFLALVPYEGIASFSSLTLALYILFIPDMGSFSWEFLPKLKTTAMRAAGVLGFFALWGGVAYMISKSLAHQTWPTLQTYGALTDEKNLAGVILSAFLFVPMGAWVINNFIKAVRSPEKATVKLLGPAWLLILPILAVFNGLCPYLGLKTQTSFAMFSNLRTEEGKFNHMFLPPSMQVFDYQKEVITVTKAPVSFTPSSSDVLLVPIEFRRRYAKLKKGDEVDFVRNGEPAKLIKGEPSGPNGDLAKPLSFWQAKLLRFRPVIEGIQPCRH